MGHHYTSNRAAGSQASAEYKAIDSTYKELTENNNIDTTYLERTFAEMKQNPAKFNLPTDGSFSDTNFRDAALKYTIDNGGGTIRQFFENKILGNYMTEYIVQEATIAETSMNATEAA